jgi:mono/diheme cytochrome c family protein
MLVTGCHTDMWVQPRLKPQMSADFGNWSADQMASRPVVSGTVARGQQHLDIGYFTGRMAGQYVTAIPSGRAMNELKLRNYKEFVQRGQERFTIYCTPCHGRLGDGQGMIAQRGLALRRNPATYHTDRLRKMPVGHFFDVMTNGYGAMYSYASRVDVADRWAIAAYIRVLQLSQNVKVSDLPPGEGAKVEPEPPTADKARQKG